MLTVTNTLESGIERKILRKEEEYKSGKMVLGTRGSGKIIKLMDMADLFMPKVTSMKASGRMTWLTGTDSTQVSLETIILANGRTTRGTNTGRKFGLTGPITSASTKTVPNTVSARSRGAIRTLTRATL